MKKMLSVVLMSILLLCCSVQTTLATEGPVGDDQDYEYAEHASIEGESVLMPYPKGKEYEGPSIVPPQSAEFCVDDNVHLSRLKYTGIANTSDPPQYKYTCYFCSDNEEGVWSHNEP